MDKNEQAHDLALTYAQSFANNVLYRDNLQDIDTSTKLDTLYNVYMEALINFQKRSFDINTFWEETQQ